MSVICVVEYSRRKLIGSYFGVYERWQTAPESVRYLTSLEYESNHLSSLSEREYYFPCYGTGESASFNLICLIVKSGIYLDKAIEPSTVVWVVPSRGRNDPATELYRGTLTLLTNSPYVTITCVPLLTDLEDSRSQPPSCLNRPHFSRDIFGGFHRTFAFTRRDDSIYVGADACFYSTEMDLELWYLTFYNMWNSRYGAINRWQLT